jgi:hypothetical protein
VISNINAAEVALKNWRVPDNQPELAAHLIEVVWLVAPRMRGSPAFATACRRKIFREKQDWEDILWFLVYVNYDDEKEEIP